MALSLGIKQGSKIQVGKSVLEVKDLTPPSFIVLSIDGGNDIVVSDQSRQEILPDVFVFSAGENTNRLVFEAPREVLISRVKNEKVIQPQDKTARANGGLG
jgi:sRNA-binding carbon storage regulator CsrA